MVERIALAKEGIGYAKNGCDLKNHEGWDFKQSEGWDD